MARDRALDESLGLDAASLRQQLARVWPAFFARHGNFTQIQHAAIPHILAGKNVLLIAATAAGKTEAALAPLLERHVLADEPRSGARQETPRSHPSSGSALYSQAADEHAKLRILYICPTRALVRDLYERLRLPLSTLRVSFAMKSGDTGPVSAQNPPAVLITTPESTDSLLTRAPRLFTEIAAVILDEIHLFDHSARGDHLRCLLRRIEQIRRYAAARAGDETITGQPERVGTGAYPSYTPMQRLALSATVPDAEGVAQRYLADALDASTAYETRYEIVQASGSRRLSADIQPMYGLDDLTHAVTRQMVGPGARRPQTPLRKALVFCNTRNEVEQVAAHLRDSLPAEAAVFVHYSNLDAAMRREVEDDFAAAPVALCVCTSTLELGIDIGSIDHAVLIGPPPSPASFMQRIGRSGRRTGVIRVLCLARSHLEDVRFRALLELAQPHAQDDQSEYAPAYHFRPSVLVQQTFSTLKQSPTGGIRLADLQRAMPQDADPNLARPILEHLVFLNYLQPGRLGEWRSGPALDELVDAHEIYSNIGADPLAAVVVDAYTGKILAQVERIRLQGETFLLGGRMLEVVWRDGYRVGVRPHRGHELGDELRFAATPFAIPLVVGQAVARHLGVAPGELCLLQTTHGVWLFHFWGDLYGMLLAALLRAHFGDELEARPARRPHGPTRLVSTPNAVGADADSEDQEHRDAPEGEDSAWVARANEHALRLPRSLDRLPPYDPQLAQQELYKLMPRVTPTLDLGRFHSLLPPALAEDAVMQQCDLPRFQRLYRAARIHQAETARRARLLALL